MLVRYRIGQLPLKSFLGTGTCCLMWCLEQLLLGLERLLRGRNRLSGMEPARPALTPAGCPNVLTPDRIPEFCIPATRVLPDSDCNPRLLGQQARGLTMALATDWDPRSQAALSFSTCPGRALPTASARCSRARTRRRESLFLGGPGRPRRSRPRPVPGPTPTGRRRRQPFTPPGESARLRPARPAVAPSWTRSARARCHRFLRASELLRRAADPKEPGHRPRHAPVSSGDEDDEDESRGPLRLRSPARAPGASPSPTQRPLPRRRRPRAP